MPAWQQVGAPAWADFSRHADLVNGLFLYPIEAIGSFVLILAAMVNLHLDRAARGRAALPIYGAVLLSVGGLLCTLKAAPIMLGVEGLGDPAALRQAFDGFHFWGNIRAAFQVLASSRPFGHSLWRDLDPLAVGASDAPQVEVGASSASAIQFCSRV